VSQAPSSETYSVELEVKGFKNISGVTGISENNSLSWSYASVHNYLILGYYAASICNSSPTFRDNLSVPSSRLKNQILDPWKWDQ